MMSSPNSSKNWPEAMLSLLGAISDMQHVRELLGRDWSPPTRHASPEGRPVTLLAERRSYDAVARWSSTKAMPDGAGRSASAMRSFLLPGRGPRSARAGGGGPESRLRTRAAIRNLDSSEGRSRTALSTHSSRFPTRLPAHSLSRSIRSARRADLVLMRVTRVPAVAPSHSDVARQSQQPPPLSAITRSSVSSSAPESDSHLPVCAMRCE